MTWPKRDVSIASSGHLSLSWPAAGPLCDFLLGWRLRLRHGLRREGRAVFSPDAFVLPGFVPGGLRLLAGWNIWSGHDRLSQDDAGDWFLDWFAGADLIQDDRRP